MHVRNETLIFLQPAQFADLQTGRAGPSGSGWTPMATSTQMGGANYGEMSLDSGLAPVQKQVDKI